MHIHGQKLCRGRKVIQHSSYAGFLTFKPKPWNVPINSQALSKWGRDLLQLRNTALLMGRSAHFQITFLLHRCFLEMKKGWMTLQVLWQKDIYSLGWIFQLDFWTAEKLWRYRHWGRLQIFREKLSELQEHMNGHVVTGPKAYPTQLRFLQQWP